MSLFRKQIVDVDLEFCNLILLNGHFGQIGSFIFLPIPRFILNINMKYQTCRAQTQSAFYRRKMAVTVEMAIVSAVAKLTNSVEHGRVVIPH